MWLQSEFSLAPRSRGFHLITPEVLEALPERAPYYEGDDDMPAHIKSSILGVSLTLPVTDGRLNLGTWQGIYLCEHRDHARGRRLVATVHGEDS